MAWLAPGLRAEETPPAGGASPTRLAAPVVIGKFVPPAPVPPKEVPAMRVEGSVTRQRDGKRLTILRGAPSDLPDIPRPVAPEPPTPEQTAAREALAALRPRTVSLQMGATIFGDCVSIVHWRHPRRPELSYEAVVGMDFGVFSPVGNFFHDNIPHQLHCMPFYLPPRAWEHRREEGQELAGVAEGSVTVTRGDPDDAAGMYPLTTLMALFAAEKDNLLAARAAVREFHREAEAWRKAHPEAEPAQSTFWLRPHRGSRYLQPQTEGGAR